MSSSWSEFDTEIKHIKQILVNNNYPNYLVDSEINIDFVNDLTFVNDLIEIMTFYIFGKNYRYLLCAIYRPPGASIRDFNDLFFDSIMNRFPNNVKVIITGDFNINLYNPYQSKVISDFISGCLGLVIIFTLL